MIKSDKPFKQLIADYIAQHDVSADSRNTYRRVLMQFLQWSVVSKRNIRNLSRQDIIAYKDDMLKSGKTIKTTGLYITVVRSLYQYLSSVGVSEDITIGIKSPRRRKTYSKQFLYPAQVTQMLTAINTNTIEGLRDYAIISLMVRCGLRCVEVSRLNVEDIKTIDGINALAIQRKRALDKSVVIGIPDKAQKAIETYLIASNNSAVGDPMFRYHNHKSNGYRIKSYYINHIIKKYLTQIGLTGKRYTAHSLRHTAACNALEHGATIFEVSQMLGHESTSTTEVYLCMMEEIKALTNTASRILDDVY